MSPFLLYVARAGLYLGLFYAFYLLVMRRTSFFRLNRVMLMAGSYLCLLLPFIRLRTVASYGFVPELPLVVLVAEPEGVAAPAAFPWQDILLAVYIAGAIVVVALFGVSARKMSRLIGQGEEVEGNGCRLVVLSKDIPSFSCGRMVVMSRKDLEENPAIFTHEMMHVKHRHSLDLLLLLPVQVLFWWNPLVWIIREELRLLHEYEADEGVIRKGINATQYQLLLVRKAVGDERFFMASGFRHAKLKNRINMMTKPSSSNLMRWSYLIMVPIFAAFMFACNPAREQDAAVSEEIPAEAMQLLESLAASTNADLSIPETGDAVPFSLVEQKPAFKGGDANEFSKWVNGELQYPESAKENHIQGRVTLQFTVETDGSVRNVRVLRGAHELLDAEALRVLSSSPKWEPGKQNGEAVPVTYTFPVTFQLK